MSGRGGDAAAPRDGRALRRRAMAGLVVLAAAWPLVHHGLVLRYDVDPWELFGWSMYAVPLARVSVEVDLERDGETEPLRAMGELRARVRGFARRRSALGTLASSEPLARMLLNEDAGLDAVLITTHALELDPETAVWGAREHRERHVR